MSVRLITAAFNTVDHELLLLRLERQFGVRGVALQCFGSYLVRQIFSDAVWWLTATVVQCCYTVLSSSRIVAVAIRVTCRKTITVCSIYLPPSTAFNTNDFHYRQHCAKRNAPVFNLLRG